MYGGARGLAKLIAEERQFFTTNK